MMPETSSNAVRMLDEATSYLARGWSIFPICTPVGGTDRCLQHGRCTSPGKVPLVQWKMFQVERPTLAAIQGWWRRWPDANIGLATGELSGVVVLDLDGDIATREALNRGVDIGPLAYTGRVGGRHLYFKYRADAPTIFSKPKTIGIDFRGQGGYVLLPPSLHRSGARYRWSENADTEIYDLPHWVDELGAQHKNGTANGHAMMNAGALDMEYLVENGVDEGVRDETLFKLAARLRGSDIPYDLAIELVERVAERCRPPFPLAETRAKVESAYRRYEPNPEPPPPIRLAHRSVDPRTGEVIDDDTWQWRVYDIEEFMALDIPPIQWLVDRLIRDQAIVGNFGGPGTLKTYFMTQLAITIAAGEHFLGVYECRQARVLIVEEDTLEADYQQAYLAPMLKAMHINPADIKGWLSIAPPCDMLLDQPDRLAALEAKISEFRPALVCLDAFYLLHSGEGMTAKDLQPILFTLKRLRRTYGCAFWLIDHNRKTTGAALSDESAMDRWYGGRSKSAASDAVIETRARKDDDGSASFHYLKLRGSKLPKPIEVRLVDGKMVIDADESLQASDGTKTLVINWLLTQQSGRTLNDVKLGTKLSHRHVQRACGELAAAGRIQKVGKAGRADLWQLAEQTGETADSEGLPWPT